MKQAVEDVEFRNLREQLVPGDFVERVGIHLDIGDEGLRGGLADLLDEGNLHGRLGEKRLRVG